MNIIQTKPNPRLALIDDIICLSGKIGSSQRGTIKKIEYMTLCKYVHVFNDMCDGINESLKYILNLSGVSAEIQLEDIPFAQSLVKQYGSQPSRLYKKALYEGDDDVMLLTIDPKYFADVSIDYQIRFGAPLHAIGRIVNGDPQHINYIENAFPTMQFNIPGEHFC